MKSNSPKYQKLYLGNYMYFATGEGYHSYLLLVQADNKKDALESFTWKVMSKYTHSEPKNYPYFKAGCSITEISEVKPSDFTKPYDQIIESVQALCKRDGMAGGYFELMFRYNLS